MLSDMLTNPYSLFKDTTDRDTKAKCKSICLGSAIGLCRYSGIMNGGVRREGSLDSGVLTESIHRHLYRTLVSSARRTITRFRSANGTLFESASSQATKFVATKDQRRHGGYALTSLLLRSSWQKGAPANKSLRPSENRTLRSLLVPRLHKTSEIVGELDVIR